MCVYIRLGENTVLTCLEYKIIHSIPMIMQTMKRMKYLFTTGQIEYDRSNPFCNLLIGLSIQTLIYHTLSRKTDGTFTNQFKVQPKRFSLDEVHQ